MYFVKYGGEYLHDPRTDDRILTDLTFEGGENEASMCEFSMHPEHPLYDVVYERSRNKQIVIYDDRLGEADPYFYGYAYEIETEFNLVKTVKCKGDLAFLNDSVVRPPVFEARHEQQTSPDYYFEWLLTWHNATVYAERQFELGVNQLSSLVPAGATVTADDSYESTGEAIKEKLLDEFGGVLQLRWVDGVRYIDYVAEWDAVNAQVLDFGVNLLDFMRTDDAVDLASCVVPTGAKMSETEYDYDDGYRATSDRVPAAGVEYYYRDEDGDYRKCSEPVQFEAGTQYYTYDESADQSENKLTLRELFEDGHRYDDDIVKNKDYLYSEESVGRYGLVYVNVDFPEAKTGDELIKSGALALKGLLSPKRTIEVKAVDLSLINPDLKPIRVGEYVRVRSKPHSYDSYMLCTNVKLDLNNPENSTYVLGTTFDKLTGQQNRRINALNRTVNKTYEQAAALSDEAKRAAEAASAAQTAVAKAVVSTRDEYAVSDSQTVAPVDGWSTKTPVKAAGQFVWRRSVVTYGDGSEVTGNPAVMSGSDGEDATVLRIDSSRGTVFKNSEVSTVLTAVIYRGSKRISDASALVETFGPSAYLEWSWQRMDEERFGVISSDDARIGAGGFTLALSPADVDTKAVFSCTLIID